MPNYEYRCPLGHEFTIKTPLTKLFKTTKCRVTNERGERIFCDKRAKRILSVPALTGLPTRGASKPSV